MSYDPFTAYLLSGQAKASPAAQDDTADCQNTTEPLAAQTLRLNNRDAWREIGKQLASLGFRGNDRAQRMRWIWEERKRLQRLRREAKAKRA
jgi:hypothetical protein